MTAHSELVARLEGASEGSRELDCGLAVLLDGFITEPSRYGYDTPDYAYIDADGGRVSPGHGGDQLVPDYTTSLDAALALAERVLPDTCRVGWQELPDRSWRAVILRVEPDEGECPDADAPTPALAMCIGVLRAKEPQPDGDAS